MGFWSRIGLFLNNGFPFEPVITKRQPDDLLLISGLFGAGRCQFNNPITGNLGSVGKQGGLNFGL